MAKYYIDREALIEWLKRIPLIDLSDGLRICRVIFEDDFKKAIKKMPKGIVADVEPVQQWIPVTERLPVIGRSVIAYNAPAKCVAEAMYKGEGRFLQFRWEARLQDQEVTHWMPLPKPPKGE